MKFAGNTSGYRNLQFDIRFLAFLRSFIFGTNKSAEASFRLETTTLTVKKSMLCNDISHSSQSNFTIQNSLILRL